MGVALLYRYRWHIRLAMYDGRGDRLQRNFQQPHYQYDVFVSYDSEDFDWVHNCLRPQLEDGLGLRLCLHERDFTPGVPIVRNIMRSVETSKKMMMIFSQGFAESQWCQFELQLCLTHVMDTGDALLVVLLNNIQPRELTPTMMAVMKTTTYIEWADDPDARDAFWGRIPRALYDILPHG
nr:hypothetical protein BaRGS_030058 [Batillaria attramentaria]